jgi:hypothetical protein
MARVNIEDELHADPRFRALVRRLGDEDRAVGMLHRFWRIAQRYWGNEKQLVPDDVFALEDLEVLVGVGFAVRKAEGVYARGAEERFDWYLQKCRAARAAAAERKRKAELRLERARSTGDDAPVNRSDGSGQPEAPTSASPVNPPTPAPTPTPVQTPLRGVSLPRAGARGGTETPAGVIRLREEDPRITGLDLQRIWNAHRGKLPECRELSYERQQAAWDLLRANADKDADYWVEVVKRIAKCSLAKGLSSGWKPSFTWLLKPDSHLRVMEGEFDGDTGGGDGLADTFAELRRQEQESSAG